MAAKVNIVIDQGATFNTTYTIHDVVDEPIDFTGFTANSQIRKTFSSSNSYTFDVALSNSGLVTLSMNAATTSSIVAGRYVYDVEVESLTGIRSRVVEGIVTVTPQVTR